MKLHLISVILNLSTCLSFFCFLSIDILLSSINLNNVFNTDIHVFVKRFHGGPFSPKTISNYLTRSCEY